MRDSSTVINGKLKWPPHPSITEKCWEAGTNTMERCSAGVTVPPVKSMPAVALLDWELWDLVLVQDIFLVSVPRALENLPWHTAAQSLLKDQWGHFRIRIDYKKPALLVQGEWNGSHTSTSHTHQSFLRREQNKDLSNSQRDLNIARFLEKQLHLRYTLQIRTFKKEGEMVAFSTYLRAESSLI